MSRVTQTRSNINKQFITGQRFMPEYTKKQITVKDIEPKLKKI